MKIKYVAKDKKTNKLIGWEGIFGGERFIVFECERILRLGHYFDGRKVKKEKMNRYWKSLPKVKLTHKEDRYGKG